MLCRRLIQLRTDFGLPSLELPPLEPLYIIDTD